MSCSLFNRKDALSSIGNDNGEKKFQLKNAQCEQEQ
jgi:hypothetical protein